MAITLYVEPRRVYKPEEFKAQKPPFSIGLDGIIHAPTMRDPSIPIANFDHHSGVDRIATRSTSEQVHMDINLGLFDTFRKEGIPHANLYVNDPDEDTCLAVWLLQHHELVSNHAQPSINRLVYCEDRLDSTAGAYPFGDTSMRRKMAWIFEPYNSARFRGELAEMSGVGMKNIIESVGGRISQHIIGEGSELALEGNYEKIGGGDGWALVRETGPASRMAMFNDGVKAFVAMVSEKKDGSRVYSIGRRSVWTQFPIPDFYSILNNEEGDRITDSNRWGGSDVIGGSPRSTGSMIPPERLCELLNEYLAARKPLNLVSA